MYSPYVSLRPLVLVVYVVICFTTGTCAAAGHQSGDVHYNCMTGLYVSTAEAYGVKPRTDGTQLNLHCVCDTRTAHIQMITRSY
jgi:hypothetical protein